MKRTHSNMTCPPSEIPKMTACGPEMFKNTLEGTYTLKIKSVVDISKPKDRPVDEIERPEEEEVAKKDHLDKNNARMLLLDLCNTDITESNISIKALETERIEALNNVKPNNLINLIGPIELRCGNLMLEKRHILNISAAPEQTTQVAAPTASASTNQPPNVKNEQVEIINVEEDWDEDDEEDCIILD